MSVVVAPELQFKSSLARRGGQREPRGHCGLAFSFLGDASGGSATCNLAIPFSRSEDRVFMLKALKMRATTDPGQGHIICNLQWPFLQVQGAGPVVLVHAFDFNVEATLGTFNSGDAGIETWPEWCRSLIFQTNLGSAVYWPVQAVWGTNTNATTYLIDCWGYWWDKTVIGLPGGPRIPR